MKTLTLPKISSLIAFPYTHAIPKGHEAHINSASRHNKINMMAGSMKYKKKSRKQKKKARKQKKKKSRKQTKKMIKKGGSTCGCGNTPSNIVSFSSGSSNNMSPNPNANIASAQQAFADGACASSGDNASGWGQTGGSDLGKFMESLNNMSGGKKKKTKRKRRSKRCIKKRLRKKMICFKGSMKHLKKIKKVNKTRLTKCSKLRLKK